MRSFSVSVLWVVAVVAVLASCGEPPARGTPVVVATQDLGMGADLAAVLAASTADVPALVDAMWAEKDQSSFAVRAGAIADGIKLYGPDLVGLQSVIQWRQQLPASAAPADELVTDYLDLLLAALAARGLAYDPVSVVTTADIELTGASGNDYRLTDREVILAWHGLTTNGGAGGTYAAQRTVSIGGVSIEDRRGWASVSVARDGNSFQFVSTRLEAVDRDVRRAQALELARMLPADAASLLVGNLGPDAELSSSPVYEILFGNGSSFTDVTGSAGAGFPSCCRDVVCVDPAARLDRRADFVLGSRHFRPSWGSWTGGNGAAMAGGLWPSDHAAIVAGAWLQ